MRRNENAGKILLNLRGTRTQAQVADGCGISQQQYARYENGTRWPSDDIKIALADYYGVPMIEIFFVD